MEATERRAVTEKHINMIVSLARGLVGRFRGHVTLAELISFGAEGAMKALERYDPRKAKAATFMRRRVVGAMLDGVRSQSEPRYNREKRRIVRALREELTQALGRPPLEDEIDQTLKVRGYRWYFRPEAWARPIQGYAGLERHKRDYKIISPDKLAAYEDTIEFLCRDLDERDRKIAEMRIRDEKDLTTIGKAVGLSEAGTSLRWKRIKAVLQERIEVAA